MARTVYSVNFIRARVTVTAIEYIVPAGSVIVVRDVDAIVYAGSTGLVTMAQGSSGVGIWSTVPTGSAQATQMWRGRQVINAGSILYVQPFGTVTADVTISGYVLSLP